jgi:hypothetical protein
VKTDLAISRSFRLPGPEGLRVQFRGELFNAFNQVNLREPAANASSPSFGRLTSANAPRVGQIAAKVIW